MKALKNIKKQHEKKEKEQDYQKYRWFFTSNNHLVIGGKSAEQNEEVINKYKKINPKYIVMHTKSPGSPFSFILAENPTDKDLEEAAIFTACFSRAWRELKKKEVVDIFLAEQIIKNKSMKQGTFGVIGKIDRKTVELKLYLTNQKNILRAIPQKTKDSIAITPGKINKQEFAEQIAIKLEKEQEEVLQALPTGGSQITK